MRASLVALALLAFLPAPARALTDADIEATVPRANYGLRRVTERLAGSALRGRDNDTPESLRAQAVIARHLRPLGEGVVLQPFIQSEQAGTNVLTIIRGRELPDEYVVVGGHYDHLDSRSDAEGRCRSRGTPGGDICNGATDNATGTALVLAVGRALTRLPTPPRRSVVLALWDAEEDGLLGSLYYVNNPLVPLADTVAYVNVDIQGSNLLPSLAGTTFAVGAETGGAALGDPVAAAAAAEGLIVHQLRYIFGEFRSDYVNFGNRNVPTVFFSDSTNGCYHTTSDDVRYVDFTKLRAQSRTVFRTVAALAEKDPAPVFVPGGSVVASYEDAVALEQVFATALVDLAVFDPAGQAEIQATHATLASIVADGPAAFDNVDVGTLLTAAAGGIGLLEGLGCRGF